ncbi:MAG: hypothetical protein ACSLFQ_01545 [Thermoanaerobaculia bacterium]
MTSKRTLLLLLAILAGMVALPANAEPSIGGLSAEAAARVLRAQGVRVLAIGLELAPDPPRAAVAQPATHSPAEKAAPRAERRGCNPWRRDLVVIPPKGVTLTPGPTVYISSNAFPRRARR